MSLCTRDTVVHELDSSSTLLAKRERERERETKVGNNVHDGVLLLRTGGISVFVIFGELQALY
jgi:hypothetical protein